MQALHAQASEFIYATRKCPLKMNNTIKISMPCQYYTSFLATSVSKVFFYSPTVYIPIVVVYKESIYTEDKCQSDNGIIP
jgi:hypothetical protein